MIELTDKWLNLIRLELEVYTDNEPAIRLYKKFDFIIEGTHVNFAYRDGQYVDAHFMARLKKEAQSPYTNRSPMDSRLKL